MLCIPCIGAHVQLEETSAILPKLLEETQEKLQSFLSEAQGLSLQRYALADKLANLVSQLSSDRHDEDGALGEQSERGQTVLEQMQVLQAELRRLEAGLAWVTVLERVLTLRHVPCLATWETAELTVNVYWIQEVITLLLWQRCRNSGSFMLWSPACIRPCQTVLPSSGRSSR